MENGPQNASKMLPKSDKNEHRKTNKCLKKGASELCERCKQNGCGREGSPYRTAPQDNNTSQPKQIDQGKQAKPG